MWRNPPFLLTALLNSVDLRILWPSPSSPWGQLKSSWSCPGILQLSSLAAGAGQLSPPWSCRSLSSSHAVLFLLILTSLVLIFLFLYCHDHNQGAAHQLPWCWVPWACMLVLNPRPVSLASSLPCSFLRCLHHLEVPPSPCRACRLVVRTWKRTSASTHLQLLSF